MFVTKLTQEQRLEKAVVRIMTSPKYIALAGVMMIGDRSVCDKTPTACTDGKNEKYGRAFIDTLTDAELRFLILHECYHKLYRHLTTWQQLYKKNPRLANVACDYVINLKISNENTDGFAVMPSDGLLDTKYAGMDTAKVFYMLVDDDENGEGGSGGEESLDEHDWEGAQEMDAQESKQLDRDIDQAIRQGALSAGKMGGNGALTLGDLLEPQVDWREVLRDFVTNTCAGRDYSTWAKPNRRYVGMGYYMPSGISEEVGELVIGIDTSGSINASDLSMFLSEVVSICETVNPERVRILYWGSSVVGDETYESNDLHSLASSTKPKGGGGTDVNCMTQYIKDKGINAQAAIVLTDGHLYSGWGQWDMPVLWTILDNKSALADVGKTVHITGGL